MYHYYPRDTRRNISPTIVSENSKMALLGDGLVEIAVPKVRPPGPNLYEWKVVVQPDSDGYFPIRNVQ